MTGPSREQVDGLARVLMAEWERVEHKPVTASYVATFADMARAAYPLLREGIAAEVLAPIEALASDWEYAAAKIQQDAAPTPQNRADIELLVAMVGEIRTILTAAKEQA